MALVPSVLYHRLGETAGIGSLPAARILAISRVKPRCFSSSTLFGLTLYSGLRARPPHFSRYSSPSSYSSHDKDERQEERGERGKRGISFAQTWEPGRKGQGESSKPKDEDEQREWARREEEFQSMLRVPREERDKAQRMQVIDRAAAALAAVNAFLADFPTTGSLQAKPVSSLPGRFPGVAASSTPADPPRHHSAEKRIPTSGVNVHLQCLTLPQGASAAGMDSSSSARSGFQGSPGPDFWSWVPPAPERKRQPLQSKAPETKPSSQVLQKDETHGTLSINFETAGPTEETFGSLIGVFQKPAMPSLPPLQSLMEVEKEKLSEPDVEPDMKMARADTEEQLRAVSTEESSTRGVNPNGSRWWQKTGVEERADGVICSWTVIRRVSADEATEWEEKFWEASDALEYKELGAEKSGRDLSGKVWREFWKETMGQDADGGMLYMERSADKWGKNAVGGEWREKWFEHYDASGNTQKWADKWSRIDPNTPLEAGHAHTWRERWGESFDGQGAMKYTDKWAERKEHGDSWMKWGDKWDEHFDRQGSGVKQGETWWEGIDGERWNRTWGEGHNGTGWIHKYGKSSSGEHWDTHVQEDTWYERRPHFGFRECYENSGKLRSVKPRKKEQS